MINTVLFDLDGTLIDTAADLTAALNQLRREYHQTELPVAAIRHAISLGSNEMIKQCFGIHPREPRFQTMKAKFIAYYRALNDEKPKAQLFDGILEVLSVIENKQQQWGIVTNKLTELTHPLLKSLALDQRPACVVCGDTLSQCKPHPAPIRHACKLLKADPAHTVYIGDAKGDITAGKSAGTKTLVALYGYIGDHNEPQHWQADGMVNSAIEIIDKLSELDH